MVTDKVGGEKFSKDFEESASQVESFLQRYEKFVEQRKQLLELLERGSVYYHAQYHEAKIVVNVSNQRHLDIQYGLYILRKLFGKKPMRDC